MKNKNNNKNVEVKFESTLKLTDEEIKSIQGYEHLNSEELVEMREFIYNISIVLYKTFDNEQT